ncbi:MAG TPA: AAA family ATPase [Candidatus Udaeobacter sp.]
MPSPKLSSPFLKKASFSKSEKQDAFPFNLPLFSHGLEIEFTKPITFFVGENGSGKSTILEAIASKCGFSLMGGNRNHLLDESANQTALAQATKLSWLPKVTKGFFMRAESFFDFANQIDEIAKTDSSVLMGYGDKSLHEQSHGESFLALFNNRFVLRRGIYILDEPEAALSPTRQLSLLAILNQMEKEEQNQFIIATHSPILLSYPGATIFSIENGKLKQVNYKDTEHYKLTKNFLDNPERYFKHLFS